MQENRLVRSEYMKRGEILLQRVYREACQGISGYQRLQGIAMDFHSHGYVWQPH